MSEASNPVVRPGRRPVMLAFVALLLVALGATIVIFRFVASERERDMQAWQIRLGIVADSRTAAVEDWLKGEFGAIRELADNGSLQIYMTELSLAGGDRNQVTAEPAQIAYLRNLLIATAEREGFSTEVSDSAVNANVPRRGLGGIAVLDAKGVVMVATPGMAPLDGAIRDFLNGRRPNERALMDALAGPGGVAVIGFAEPVFGVQADRQSPAIGTIFGLRAMSPALAGRLVQPGETENTAETLLVRRVGARIDYLGGLRDGAPPLGRTLAADTPNLDAAFAIDHPGGFAERIDYAGHKVLVVARQLSVASWTLLRKVDSSEALMETERRSRLLLWTLLGALSLASLAIVAVWWKATGLKAAEDADRYRLLADRFGRLSGFLRHVTNGQPTNIFAVDSDDRLTFANSRAVAGFGMQPEEVVGKSMAAVFGPAEAGVMAPLNRQALQAMQPVESVRPVQTPAGERTIKSDHIPLALDDRERGVLIVQEDITDIMLERARREDVLRQLVATLVSLIDRRDPFASHHSARVAEVSTAIATEMNLPPVMVDTVGIVARLMNLGKIAVPPELLTKMGPLDEDERQRIQESIHAGADLLDNVPFDGPVVESLHQLREHYDGSGEPRGLRSEAILLPARIVAVANAFIGMVSPRAWRPPLALDLAAQQLLGEAGQRYDRAVVIALINVLENRDGKRRWAHFATAPRASQPS